MGRILLFAFLGGLGLWAYTAAARGPSATDLSKAPRVESVERVRYIPIIPYVPPSNRTGSTRGPRVGGGGPSSGK